MMGLFSLLYTDTGHPRPITEHTVCTLVSLGCSERDVRELCELSRQNFWVHGRLNQELHGLAQQVLEQPLVLVS